jgi:uncharacterized protein YfbU (UPF0304 family)
MATVSIRMDDALQRRIEEAADGEGLSVSEWARQQIMSSMGLSSDQAWSAPTTLSKRDRQQLALLHRLVELSTPDEYEAEYHAKMATVLHHGYTGEYSDEFISIEEEMPMAECRLVWSLLDMFRVIKASVEEVGTDKVRELDDLAETVLGFRGFDFNDAREGRMADYAAHLTATGRWEDLAMYFDNEHERGNSHFPALDTYLRMLDVFTPIWTEITRSIGRSRYLLNEEELKAIVLAAYHPSQRPT